MLVLRANNVASTGEQVLPDVKEIGDDDDFDLMNVHERKMYLDRKRRELQRDAIRKVEKIKRLKSMSGWIDDGQSALRNLQSKMKGLSGILKPRLVKRCVLDQLNSINDAIQSNLLQMESDEIEMDYFLFYLRAPQRILHYMRAANLRLLNKSEIQKSKLVRLKHIINCEMRYSVKNNTSRDVDNVSVLESEALRVMQDSLKKYVFVPKIRTLNWRLQQEQVKRNVRKFEKLLSNYVDCENITDCRHHNHFRPSGCPNCKVIYLNTKKDTASKSVKITVSEKSGLVSEGNPDNIKNMVQYVKSVDVETGVTSLQTLDFEFESLQEALLAQQLVIQAAHSSLQDFEDTALVKTVVSIQNWYACHSAMKRCRVEEARRLLSLFYYRIRRLVSFKRVVDSQDILHVDRRMMTDRFSELHAEVLEYLDFKLAKKLNYVQGVAVLFVQKLRTMILRKRRKAHTEATALAEHNRNKEEKAEAQRKKKYLVEMRIRVNKIENEKFICTRFECKNKIFFSRLRYDCHTLIHTEEDRVKAEKRAEMDEKKRLRDTQSNQILEKIRSSREALSKIKDDLEEKEFPDPDAVGESLLHTNIYSKSVKSDQSIYIPTGSLLGGQIVTGLFLELVSIRKGYWARPKIPLDRPVVRLGTSATCEWVVRDSVTEESLLEDQETENALHSSSGKGRGRGGVISGVHCIMYCTKENDISTTRIIDNNSTYGTYVINMRGLNTVSRKLSEGLTVHPGDLICLGVKPAKQTVTAREASDACIILRVCKE